MADIGATEDTAANAKKGNLSRRRFIRRSVAAGVGAGLLYSAGTAMSLEVTRNMVHIPRLPRDLDGLRIVFGADFHLGPRFALKKLSAAVDRMESLGADVVLMGGDYVGFEGEYFADAVKELSRLKAPLGVWAVPGNHDYWGGYDLFEKALQSASFGYLRNQSVRLVQGLHLVGLDDEWGGDPDWQNAAAGVPEDAGRLVLCHNPVTAESLPGGSADLILAGHTHGWQVYVPLVTRFFIKASMGDALGRYRWGFYDTAAGGLYVTRGVGALDPAIRWWCRPEIAVFELKSGPKE